MESSKKLPVKSRRRSTSHAVADFFGEGSCVMTIKQTRLLFIKFDVLSSIASRVQGECHHLLYKEDSCYMKPDRLIFDSSKNDREVASGQQGKIKARFSERHSPHSRLTIHQYSHSPFTVILSFSLERAIVWVISGPSRPTSGSRRRLQA